MDPPIKTYPKSERLNHRAARSAWLHHVNRTDGETVSVIGLDGGAYALSYPANADSTHADPRRLSEQPQKPPSNQTGHPVFDLGIQAPASKD
jgi:hypothetical protein